MKITDIFTVSFEETYHFYPGEPAAELTAEFQDGYVLKLDSDNDFLWVKQFKSTQAGRIKDAEVNSENELLIVGVFKGGVDSDPSDDGEEVFNTTSSNQDIFITNLDSEGIYEWSAHIIGWGAEIPTKFAIDDEDNLYVVGTFFGPVDFDPGMDEFILPGTEGSVTTGFCF